MHDVQQENIKLHINPEAGEAPDLDTLWGVEAIARFIGCPIRRAYYLIERGKLPVRKLSHRTIVASKRQLRAAMLAGGDA